MGDKNYRVVVDLDTKGKLADDLGKGADRADKLHGKIVRVRDELGSMASSATGAFTGAVEAIGGMAAALTKVAGLGALGAITYGVAGLNKELESSKIGLAAIFNANGMSAGIPAGIQMSSDVLKQMRKDAAALPGESADLINIFRLAANPAFKNGMSAQGLESMSASAMAAGASFGMDQHQVAREFAMLQQGRAGAHNVFGTQLGLSAESFNGLGGKERVKALGDAIGKFEPAIAAYRNTYDALLGGVKDNAKNFLRNATEPLFERVKVSLVHINDWFDKNEAGVNMWARKIGSSLGTAWEHGTAKIEQWWPSISSFLERLYYGIGNMWDRIAPMVDHVASALSTSMGNGAFFERAESLLKLYAAVKVGGMVADGAGGLAGLAAGVGGIGAGEGAMALGGAAGIGGAIAGIALLGTAAVAAAGQISAMADAASPHHKDAMRAAKQLASSGAHLSDAVDVTIMPSIQSFGTKATSVLADVVGVFADLIDPIDNFRVSMNALRPGLGDAINRQHHVGSYAGESPYGAQDIDHAPQMLRGATGMAFMLGEITAAKAKTPKQPTGGGGATIQKVEIVVSGADDPSRIARVVFQKMQDAVRNPTASRNADNWSRRT